AARFAGAGRPFFAIVLPLAAATGTLTGAEISYRHTLATLPPAVRVDATDTIALVRDNGDYALPPALGHLRGPVDSAFDTFYVWSQRLRLFPREREFDTALDSAAVMFLRPQSPLGPEQTERLAKFVLDGGRLLVVDSILNPSAAASRILEPFGMTLETALVGDPNRALRSPRQLVRGGEPLLTDSDGQPLAAIARVGRGVVVAVAEGAGLSRAGLGTPMDDPDAAHRSRFEDVFALLRELFAAPRAK
ncbi:MAG: hypothetical protein KDE27_22725, partial [Planctomycetes bacterium]|nr:hypothetical protein [Planctomycetota bacterium]